MFYYIYILQSQKNYNLYVGVTANLRNRLAEHNRGENLSTKNGVHWVLIHYEAYRNQKDALRRERYLKTSQGSRLLKRMLKEYFYERKKKQ